MILTGLAAKLASPLVKYGIGALAVLAAFGWLVWKIDDMAAQRYLAEAVAAREARSRVVAEEQRRDAERAVAALERQAAAARARADDLARRHRENAALQGACLDEEASDDLLRLLNGGLGADGAAAGGPDAGRVRE